MKRDEAVTRRSAWENALQRTANKIGRDTPLWRVLGTTAWGRFDGEAQVGELKDNILFGLGVLRHLLAGVRELCNQ